MSDINPCKKTIYKFDFWLIDKYLNLLNSEIFKYLKLLIKII